MRTSPTRRLPLRCDTHTLLLGRDCCRGRRHRRHRHDIVGPRRRRQGHLERRERVALDAEEEASVAAERVDEGRLGVRRRDLGGRQCFGQRGEQFLRGWRAAELLRQNVERRDESAKLSARGAAPRDHSERRRCGAFRRRSLSNPALLLNDFNFKTMSTTNPISIPTMPTNKSTTFGPEPFSHLEQYMLEV